MAHTLSSKGDESQSNRYSFVYDRTPNPLLVNTNVQLSDISSMSRFLGSQGLDFPEKHVEGLSGRYSGCSTSYPREASPSRWQLSNQNSNTDYVSSNRTSENFLSATQLQMQHEPSNIQCSSSGFTCKNFENGGWKQFPDAATSYIAQVSPIISTSNHLSLPNEATGAPVMIEGEMFRELLGRLGSNHHNMSSLETIVPVTGGAHHQESPMATGCSWNEVDDASRSMDLSVNLSNEGLSHRGTDLAASLAHFPSHIPEFACMSPFSNVSSSGGAVNVTLSHEAASRFVGQSNNQSSGGATPQSSPSAILYKNPSHKFSTCENTGKIGNSIHDVVPNGENAVEGAGDLKRYKSGACHLGVSLEEARSCQNGAVSANSSDSGQYAAMHGLMLCKGLVVDTFGNGQQNCISGSKAKEMSCLSEASKQKLCETKSKRQRTFEASKAKEEPKVKLDRSSSENSGNSSPSSAKENLKPPEPPKQDYIHVRARRGQATDSHSLAERVRREKNQREDEILARPRAWL